MARNSMFSNPKYVLVVVACICFALAVLTTAGILSIRQDRLDQPGPVLRLPVVHRLTHRARAGEPERHAHRGEPPLGLREIDPTETHLP